MTTPENTSDEVRQRALDIIHEDFLLNDSVHTPPGAIGHYLPPSDEGAPDSTGDREPRRPLVPSSAGAIALSKSIDEDGFSSYVETATEYARRRSELAEQTRAKISANLRASGESRRQRTWRNSRRRWA